MDRLVFLILALSAVFPLGAQTFQASVLGGMNLSQIDGDDLFGFHKVGLNGGLRVVAVLDDRWRLGPEILFSQQGALRPNSSINFSNFSRFHLNTLEVPLMAYYKDWRLLAGAGLSYQRLFGYTIDNFEGEDVTDQFELRENLLAFNAGVTLLITEQLGVNFRWSKHLTNLDIDNAINSSFRGRTITLRIVWTPGAGETLPHSTREE